MKRDMKDPTEPSRGTKDKFYLRFSSANMKSTSFQQKYRGINDCIRLQATEDKGFFSANKGASVDR